MYIAARVRYCPRCACKYFGGDPARLPIPFRVLCVAVLKDRDFLEGARIRGGPPTGFWRNLKKNFGRPNCPKPISPIELRRLERKTLQPISPIELRRLERKTLQPISSIELRRLERKTLQPISSIELRRLERKNAPAYLVH